MVIETKEHKPDKFAYDIVQGYRDTVARLSVESHEHYTLRKGGVVRVKKGNPLHLMLNHAAEAAGITNSITVHIEDMKDLAARDKARGREVHANTAYILSNLPPLLDKVRVLRKRAVEAVLHSYGMEKRGQR